MVTNIAFLTRNALIAYQIVGNIDMLDADGRGYHWFVHLIRESGVDGSLYVRNGDEHISQTFVDLLKTCLIQPSFWINWC